MFAHIEGTVAEKNADSIVLDVHGVGFLLTVSGATLAAAPAAGERMKLYTVLNVREDAMELFGFYSREEKRMYERLRGVSGVGSRMAMQVLSGMSLRDLSVALAAGDVHALTRIPGIGKKTAQRLVLELRDKIDETQLTGASVSPIAASSGPEAEAVSALIALGFTASEAAKAVGQVAGQTDDANQMIFLALKGSDSGAGRV
ncbi:MAG TPA: Holliday junction branch migration protein RuvA [Candidatus Faecivicinus avistercoris]|nr:Holliday junction branch migration protein RuvA [Candidatus Faecivicinus avistercoris]